MPLYFFKVYDVNLEAGVETSLSNDIIAENLMATQSDKTSNRIDLKVKRYVALISFKPTYLS